MATTQTDPTTQLEIPGLHPSRPEPLPFGGGALSIRAYLLERSRGNLLIYSTTGVDVEILGAGEPIVRHYLNHHHEAMFMPDDLRALAAPLVVNELDRPVAEERAPVPVHSFSMRHLPDPDFEVIPIPGHTPGATAYLWEVGGRRLLFTGDSLYRRGGEWVAAMLDSSDRGSYIESLELIAGLEFDVLVPWVADAGSPPFTAVEPGEARARIEELVAELRAGER